MSKRVLEQYEVSQSRVESTLENVYICLLPILFFVLLALFVFKSGLHTCMATSSTTEPFPRPCFVFLYFKKDVEYILMTVFVICIYFLLHVCLNVLLNLI